MSDYRLPGITIKTSDAIPFWPPQSSGLSGFPEHSSVPNATDAIQDALKQARRHQRRPVVFTTLSRYGLSGMTVGGHVTNTGYGLELYAPTPLDDISRVAIYLHELGHLICDGWVPIIGRFLEDVRDQICQFEVQASRFALELMAKYKVQGWQQSLNWFAADLRQYGPDREEAVRLLSEGIMDPAEADYPAGYPFPLENIMMTLKVS